MSKKGVKLNDLSIYLHSREEGIPSDILIFFFKMPKSESFTRARIFGLILYYNNQEESISNLRLSSDINVGRETIIVVFICDIFALYHMNSFT